MTDRDFVHRGFGGVATADDIAQSVVLVPSRDEAATLASTWSDARLVADHYAWQLWTGIANGARLTACSTGTGSASAAIAIEELAILGATSMLGIGSILDPGVASGTVLVAEGAVRFDAASHGYVRAGFPAVPDHALVMALLHAGRRRGDPLERAILADVDAPPEVRLGTPPRLAAAAAALEASIRDTGAVRVHGSPAVLFVQGTVHGLRTAFVVAAPGPAAQATARALAVDALLGLDPPA